MTTTQIVNHIYYFVCLLAAVLSALPIDLIPAELKPYIVTVSAVLMWIKSHWNLIVNPDGTPAEAPYIKKS